MSDKVRPKSHVMFTFNRWNFIIELKPQQKWDHKVDNNFIHWLCRNNVTIKMEDSEFVHYFRKDKKHE